MKSKISQATKKSVSLLLAILMMFSMLTVGLTVTVNAAAVTQLFVVGDAVGGWNASNWKELSDKTSDNTIAYTTITGKKEFKVSKTSGNYDDCADMSYDNSLGDVEITGTLANHSGNLNTNTGGTIYLCVVLATGTVYANTTAPTSGSTTAYNVTVGSHDNGDIQLVSPSPAASNTEFEFKVKANDGFQISTVTLSDGTTPTKGSVDGDGFTHYTFTMPSNAVTISATFTATASSSAKYYLIGDDFSGWSETNNAYPVNNPVDGRNNVFYIDTEFGTGYWKLADGTSQYGPNKNTTLTVPVTEENAETASKGSTTAYQLTSGGTYRLYVDQTNADSPKVWITEVPSDPVDQTLPAPKLKGDAFVLPNGEVTLTLDNQKDFGKKEVVDGKETGNYTPFDGLTFTYEVTALGGSTPQFVESSSGKLGDINDKITITAGSTEGVTYTVKLTASDGSKSSSATATVKVATIPNKLPDRIYAYAAPLAVGALPTAYNAWAVSETAAAAQKVYRNTGDAEKIPGLGATTDTNIRIFLPTTASSTEVVLYNAFATKITVNGTDIEAGKYAKVSYTPNTEMTVSFADSRASKKLTIYKSEAQGALYINHTGEFAGTYENNVLKMISQLYTDKEKGAISADNGGAVVDNKGNVANVTVKKIKGRGNSTWRSTDKKSFNVNFNENLGGKYINSNFKGKKYSLLANFKDPSLSRNKILYALGDYMGAKYSPDVATIDLYMNGMYMGNYLMTQKVDIGSKDLVNDLDANTLIEEKYGDFATALTKTSDIAANGFSFMLELDTNAGNGDFHFDVNHGGFNQTLTIKEPEYLNDDGSMPSDALVTTIEKFIGDKYKALIDALNGTGTLADIIDIPSLARYMMLNELAKNYDIGVSSTYFVYNNTAQKFYISPVWDLDVTTGNCKETETSYQSYEGDWINSNNQLNKVMRLVFANEQVINEVKSFWTEDFYTALCTEIDRLTANAKTDAKGSFENNYVKWSYPNGFQGEYNDDVQFKTSLTTATYTAGGTYNNNASTETYQENSYSQTQFVADWLKSRAAWLTKKYATPSTPVESNWRIEYWDDTNKKHQYIAPTSVADDGTATWETNFNFGSFATDGKFRITNGETWTNEQESTFCVPAYKRTNQKGTETYVTVTAVGAGVVTDSNDFGSDAGSYGVSKYNDIKLTGIDTSKTYVVTYKPGTGNALDGQITIADKDTIVVKEPTVSITGTKLTNENIVLGTPITITATVTPLKENNVVVEGEYTVTLYRGTSVVKTDKITFTATDEQKVYTFNTELNSNDESYTVKVTKDTYSATSNTVAYKQTGVKDIKIYFDPSEIWLSAPLTINSTVTATAGEKTFTMSIDPGDDNALAKGVFRAMIDSDTLAAIKTSGVSFKLDNSTKDAITATVDASANVSDGDIYTYDSKNGSKWCSYNKTVIPAYPGGCQTYEEFVTYLKNQQTNNTDNIVYFDNSASKWYNVYIYDWNSEEGKNAQPLTKLPYADIWYYDFGENMHTLNFLFKDRSTNAYGTDYQQTVDLVGHIDKQDKYVNNANGDQVYLNFENTVNTPNPIFITANFYKCTINNPTGTDVTGYKYRAFNTEWKEFGAVIDAQVKTKAVTVYFDMHRKDVADVQLYHTSTDPSYTFASTFTRLTPLPGSTIYSATMQLPYKVVDGAVTPVFTFDKFIIGKETTVYPMSSAVQPKGDCFTTGEVWYEYNGTTPPNGKSVVSTSANAKTLVATGANVSLAATGADTYNLVAAGTKVYLKPYGNWAQNNERYAICVQTSNNDTESWADMTKVEDGVYEATIPEGSWSKLFICRMNGSTTSNSWGSKWDQSSMITDTASTNNCLSTNGSEVTWSVYTQGSSGGTISADLLSVLKGEKVMFYYGDTWNADAGTGISKKYLRTEYSKGTSVGSNGCVAAGDTITGNYNGTTTYYYSYACLPSAKYYVSNSTWEGNQMSKEAQAGKAYVLNSGNVTAIDSKSGLNNYAKSATITVGASSVDLGVSTLSDVSVVNSNNSLTYYITTDKSTFEEFNPNNTSALTQGTYYVYPVVTDGKIYVRGDAITLTVNAPTITYSVTLDKTILSLDLNGTTSATLTANTTGFTQSATVTWNSDNQAVAKVANGVVTAVGVGTTTITVTYSEGGNIKTATCTVTVKNSSVPTVDYCGILGYNHSTATFESTTGGSITDAYVELKNGYYQDAAYKTGYAITTDGITTVIYAIPTEKTGATTVYKSTTTGDTGYLFNEWTKDGAFLTSVQDLTTANVTTTNTVSYVANWSQVQKVQYTFTYKYWDQDKSLGMEYNPQNLIEKEYKVTVMLDENASDDVIKAAFRANAPKLSSDYYSYSFDSVDVTVNTDKTASATAAKTVKEYSVTIKDNEGKLTTLNTKYYYQNLVTLTAQGTLETGYRFVWKYADTENVIGYGNSISIRITDNLAVEYSQEQIATTSPDYTILHKPTYEFFTSGNVEKVRFNFLVENTVVDKDNFAEFGILYFFTDEKGVNSNVYADANVPADTLKDIVLGNTKLADVKVKKIEKYNFKNEYIFNAAMTNSDANLEKYVRVYSYIKFKDGRVVLSDTTTPVLGSLKEARLA